MARKRHEVDRGVGGGHEGVAPRLRVHARMRGAPDEFKVDLFRAEELARRRIDGSGRLIESEMRADDRVDVVKDARAHEGVGAAGAFFGGLEDELDLPREALLVRGDESTEFEEDRLVTVVPAGMHDAGAHRMEVFARRKVLGILGFAHVEGVELGADADGLPRTFRVENSDAPRETAHAVEELTGHALILRIELRVLRLFRVATAHVVGLKDFAPDLHFKSQTAQHFRSPCGAQKFAPPHFRRHVDRAAALDQIAFVNGVHPVGEKTFPGRIDNGNRHERSQKNECLQKKSPKAAMETASGDAYCTRSAPRTV